ncbi:MAG: tryptophan synthase subunit alpha [Opitutaceae bacterium]
MSRIQQAFARARAGNRAAFVAYVCAGDPDFDTSLAVCRALLANGVDILELGVPFSDPLADGLTNQLAAQRALESGMTASRVFELVKRVREFSDAPIVFYTYYNLVFANGVDAYVRAAKSAGVDGILTLDLPPEEAGEVAAACKAHGVETVFIIAPTSPDERIARIAGVTCCRRNDPCNRGCTWEGRSHSEITGKASNRMNWKTLEADGCTWEVRSTVNLPGTGAASSEDVLEFTTTSANMPPRRVVVEAGSLQRMDETALRAAYLRARPIGGDHYGRPGKRMSDS